MYGYFVQIEWNLMESNTKQQILFIAPESHEKTKSNRFLLDYLSNHFEVDYVSLDWNHYNTELKKCKKDYDFLVCWQLFLSKKTIDSISFRKGVFFPMYDSCKSVFKTERWLVYLDFKIISFSTLLSRRLRFIGIDAKDIKFFPEVTNEIIWGDSSSVFYWQRRSQLSLSHVLRMFKKLNISRLFHHEVLDSGQQEEKKIRVSNCEIIRSSWFESKEDMIRIQHDSAYYIAPRKCEGIGHSFLEAMASGKCVVGSNKSTMNEYIIHKKTGLLFNYKFPKGLPKHDLRMIQRNCYEYCKQGRMKWERERSNIIDWMDDPVHVNLIRFYFFFFIRVLWSPKKAFLALRDYRVTYNER